VPSDPPTAREEETVGEPRRRLLAALVLVTVLSSLPFAPGLLRGRTFYFRDLSIGFFATRALQVEGLRAGEIRYWNPYLHEGEHVLIPPISYPVDLLQALLPSPSGFSAILALHVPLAAVAFLLLARGLGAPLSGAAAGALVYALSGFTLSMLNLYVHIEAIAWAPFVVLGLVRAGAGGARTVAWASLLVATLFSTVGLEIALQAVGLGFVLGIGARPLGSLLRMGAALALGCGLSAATLLVIPDALQGSSRSGAGLSTDVVLAQSIHPVTLLQTLIGSLHGDLNDVANRWWGQNFFPQGFPYALSLYLGALALALAACGILTRTPYRTRLVLVLMGALTLSLGRFVGIAPIVDALPVLHALRYPVKAFHTVVTVVALLVAQGFGGLVDPGRFKRIAVATLVPGAALVALGAAPWIAPLALQRFQAGFFPPNLPWPARLETTRFILRDASSGGLLALAAGLAALLVASGRARPVFGRAALFALLATDLLRTGSGLNRLVPEAFLRPSPEMSGLLDTLRKGRVFTCSVESSAAFRSARALRVAASLPVELWAFATFRDTLSYNFATPLHVRSALGPDVTMFVPKTQLLPPGEDTCLDPGAILGRLRNAGVAHVLSLDPLEARGLSPFATLAPRDLAPLSVRVYKVEGALPRVFLARHAVEARGQAEALRLVEDPRSLADGSTVVEGSAPASEGGRILALAEAPGRVEVEAETEGPGLAVVREAWAPGWSVLVNGRAAAVLRAEGRYCAVALPSGRSAVVLSYRPPHLRRGVVVSALTALVFASLLVLGRGREGAILGDSARRDGLGQESRVRG
jgi:hypothetical protein